MDNKLSHQRNPVGCAILNHIVENAAELPVAQPSSHDVPTKRLHKPTDYQGLNPSDRWDNGDKGVYTKRLQIVRTHLVRKRGRIHYRRRVPDALQGIIGKQEIWRSLETDSPTVAKRRALRVAAQIEHEFEIARSKVGLNVDPIMLEAFTKTAPIAAASVAEPEEPNGITLGDLYDAYMDDPTRDWSLFYPTNLGFKLGVASKFLTKLGQLAKG
ncbi:DUF6538 domain-containing protein [Brevundimonas diminuta]|uniref:DUF6538 domain-containing protein n=1 Tax=Brevundimonas diminuta TaxID=293 RepID=UPI0012FC9DF4|nr:DUF6538 domain-containing protein [Brevundimonas diminuta]